MKCFGSYALAALLLLAPAHAPAGQESAAQRPRTAASSTNNFAITVKLKLGGTTYLIPNADFYLLDDNPKRLLKDAGVKLHRYVSEGEDDGEAMIGDFLAGASNAKIGLTEGGGKYLADYYREAMQVLKPHIAAATTTDKTGRASFTVPHSGVYYLIGETNEPGHALWGLQVELTGGEASVTLDNTNTMSALRQKK